MSISAPCIVHHNDNLKVLSELESESIDLIYTDPPFNTGKTQKLQSIKTVDGVRQNVGETSSYVDEFDDYLGFLQPRIEECYRVLKKTGSLFLHIDYREVHYVKVMLDKIFSRECFMNEIIWSYDYGARSKKKWSTKHDTILWYVKDSKNYCFNYDDIDRIPYMAPGLVGPEKAARGKTPTDVWWHTIVPTNGKERVNYPTQKPRGIVDRIVKVHSNSGDLCLDIFAGSGTLGESALMHDRKCILIDNNSDACRIMLDRFNKLSKE